MEQPIRKSWFSLKPCLLTERDKQNSNRASRRALLWAVSFVAATFIFELQLIENVVLQVAVAMIPTLLGVAAVQAYIKLLREADELLRRIQLEALAMGFAAGALFMLSYRLFERIGAPKLDMDDPLLVMVIFWAGGLLLGQRRYS